MLNELLLIERGLSAAGFETESSHPEVKRPGRVDALRVRLGKDGAVAGVEFLARDLVAKSWKFSEGQHNSFPFVQLKVPFLSAPTDPEWRSQRFADWKRKIAGERRHLLRELAGECPPGTNVWPPSSLRQSLCRRQPALEQLRAGDAAAVPAVIERFLSACENPAGLLSPITSALLRGLDEADDALIELAKALLVEGGALYFDIGEDEFPRDAADPRQRGAVCLALNVATSDGLVGTCALSGETSKLLSGNFPQPNLPLLGQTWLFAKNDEIRAAGRYGRFSAEAMPLGQLLTARLASAITELTAEHRKGKTWRIVPGEQPKQSDLLLAFVNHAPDAPVAEVIADDGETSDSIAEFETRARRLVQAIEAKIGADFRRTPVEVCVLRKVDPANRKVICHRAMTVKDIYDAAVDWISGERNLPEWLVLPVPVRGGALTLLFPQHVAPLQVPRLTRSQYIRGGIEVAEVTGVSAQDAFELFLGGGYAERRARSALRLLLRRTDDLLAGSAHALRKGTQHAKPYDRRAALRTLSFIGVLLHKLNRRKEDYMNEFAFKLGQLLAIADIVHVGYCADLRGGDVPPTLLGNAVLNIAKANPQRALAVLCGRWKPYGGWAKRVDRPKALALAHSENQKEERRGWDILRAAAQARDADVLCRDLHGQVPSAADDAFRAELLLGYIAGLPKREAESNRSDGPSIQDDKGAS